MNPTKASGTSPALDFDALNWVASDCLPRDREQSRRLHEPEAMITTIDPITGRDIEDPTGHPYLIDGNVVMYFESEDTRREYLDTPTDHPVRLRDNPDEEGEAEG
jgi:YHS domain-containing protein